MKKILAFVTSLALCAAASAAPVQNIVTEPMEAQAAANSAYNYGEALQKSMFFYQVQQSGPLAEWNQVTWRRDSMMTDYVQGGWFDAGDHIKFALTNAYSSVMLAWGILEFPGGPESIGLTELYKNNLKYSLDFLVGCDLGDEVVYQIGEIDFDHVWWGSAEVYMNKYELKFGKDTREYYTTTDSNITGEMAAALAAGYLVFKDSDPELAATYLEHAENCFRIGDKTRDHGNTPASDAMYKSEHFYDELFWAANWLYKATGDQKYLDLCEEYIPHLGLESQSDELKYTWGLCWDDVQQGGTFLYAMNTGDPEWINQAKKHLEYWTTGYGGKRVDYTPAGLPWLFQWGSLRHATTTAFLAYLGAETLFADDAELVKKYTDFADGVMNYAFGDNPLNMSYVIGMGESYPQAWHHRTSSGAWNDKWSNIGQTEGEDAKPHAHILYGALVGGPDKDDGYNDNIAQYQYTEVAIDYNAGYTAALCAMVDKYGGTSDPEFPPTETPKWTEFFMRASINQAADSYTEIKAYAMNHSAWPARTIKDLSYRYYFDISELVDAGASISDVEVRIGYDQHAGGKGAVSISDPVQYDGNVYYVEIVFDDGTVVMPTGQSEHRSECQFRVGVSDSLGVKWDATNDYSFQTLEKGSEDAMVDTPYITMYDAGTLIWGTEPDGTTPEETQPSTKPTEAPDKPTEEPTTKPTEEPDQPTNGGTTNVLYGDVDLSGSVDILDIIVLNKALLGSGEALSEQAMLNADVDLDGKPAAADSLAIMKYIVKIFDKLPI